ncbi:MAG: methyltransferase, TrmH family [Actinomycetota bacterium]|jgi:TrmH family RNA methyltransferase|nr:methyltransferase, TrmH family [Actinomycetota bacterium]
MTVARPDGGGLGFKHKRVQRLRKLVQRRTARDAERVFVVEGAKVLAEALDAGAPVESLYLAPGAEGSGAAGAVIERAVDAGVRVFDLGPGVIERVSGTVTPQPLLAVARYLDVGLDDLRAGTATPTAGRGPIVVCVDVRDPGNLGTVLRSAEAAGATGVICCAGTVDVYNPKSVRASAGSLFHVQVVSGGDPVEVLSTLGDWGVHRMATRQSGGTPYFRADLTRPTAIVLGNEASGLPAEVEELVDEVVTIPMAGRGDSLNVGMAAAVLCFEAARQRSP